MNQSTEQVSPLHIKIKGDLKSDAPEKKEDEIGSEKILKRKQRIVINPIGSIEALLNLQQC